MDRSSAVSSDGDPLNRMFPHETQKRAQPEEKRAVTIFILVLPLQYERLLPGAPADDHAAWRRSPTASLKI